MTTLNLLNPTGDAEITRLHASRLDTLDGKTIGVMSNDVWQAHRTLPLVCEILKERFPEATVIPEESYIVGMRVIPGDEAADLAKERGWDAVIVGNAS